MGIRVECPNGHKLNIKATQAGKRGICPRCGSKFMVPSAQGATEANGSEQTVSTVPETEAATPEPEAVVPASPWADRISTEEPTKTVDPLAEAPDATWYVRPPSGGQFGPAQADTMRAWLAEGRITGDSFVWREGWDDWVLAAETFVELAASPEANQIVIRIPGEAGKSDEPAESKETNPNAISSIAISADSHRTPSLSHRRKRERARGLVIGLAVTVVVLGIILVWVLVSRL